jgi:PAS domain S-box-containing protein
MESPTRFFAECLIALASFAIAGAFVPLARRGRDSGIRRLIALFSAFLFLVGVTELAPLWTAWSGSDGLELLLKLLAAAVSLATALLLLPTVSRSLALPSPRELIASNLELRSQVLEREGVETELRRVRSELEDRVHERTAELVGSNRALTREVAERERAEERFRRAVESSPAGMLMIDGKGRIVLANRAAEEIFDYHREELNDQPIDILVPDRFKPLHPSHRERFMAEPATRAMGAGRELFGLRSDGSEVPIEIGLNPIQTDEGLFVLSSIVDITERKQAERQAQAKHKQLERTNQELDEFAHVVSHDLKAPLRGIISLSTWIAEDCAALLPKEAQEHLQLLTQRTRRMSELIDGILRYSLAGREKSPAEPVDVGELVREVVDSLAPPPSIAVRVEAPLPIVHYDRTQLRQVFQNLLMNAIQHLGRPAGEVAVSCREEVGAFEFRVSDNGVGIGKRHFERIFRVFQALSPDVPTAGIGLAIVKKIVEKNGGSIDVTSQPGAGASFRFSVPKLPAGAKRRRRRRLEEKGGEERTDPARRG